MANINGVFEDKKQHPEEKISITSCSRFDWLVIVLGLWMIGGIHLDAWAHHQFDVETFFTPWHAVLYSGYLGLAAILLGALIRNRLNGVSWRQAIPVGYGLSLAGAGLFAVGGVGDIYGTHYLELRSISKLY